MKSLFTGHLPTQPWQLALHVHNIHRAPSCKSQQEKNLNSTQQENTFYN